MKKYLLGTILMLFVHISLAQFPDYHISRIDLRQENNFPLLKLSKILLEGYCRGDIVGYYPANPQRQLDYEVFLKRFGFLSKSACYGCQLPKNILKNFQVQLQLIEVYEFDERYGDMRFRPQYIRLIYSPAQGNDHAAVLFLFEDVIAFKDLLENYPNQSVTYSIEHFFRSRLFKYTILCDQDNYFAQPKSPQIFILEKQKAEKRLQGYDY